MELKTLTINGTTYDSFPGTGSGGGTEWETLANVTLEEDAIPVVDIGAYAVNFRALRFFVILPACTPANVTFALSVPNSTTGSAYSVCTVNSFGDESAVSKLFIEFEPMIEDGFCRVGYTWAVTPATSVKEQVVKYQYNSYDYDRLETARYLRPNMTLPAGTTITVKGARA